MEPDEFWENQAGTEPETFREIEKFDSELSDDDVMSRTQDGAAPMGTERSSYYNQDKNADGKSGGLVYNPSTRGWYDPNNKNDRNHPEYIDARAAGGTGSYFEELYQNSKSEEEINRRNKFIENDGYSFANPNTRKKQIERFGEDYEKLDSKYLGISQGLTENRRLGVEDYHEEYRADNRYDKQGTGEVIWRGLKRAGAGFVYQTIGGIASMLDFEDYFNQDNEVGNFVSNWADAENKQFQLDNEIYTGKDNSMASFNFWMKTGADLAASIGAFAVQGMGVGAVVNKGLSAVKALSKLGKAYDASKKTAAGVAAVETGTGLGGSSIRAVDRAVDLTSDAVTAMALNQAESIMSAAPRYKEAYDEAIKRGHSEEYAKQVAAYAAQTVVSTNRINFALNMTSVNKLMKASGVRAGNESAAKTWKQTAKSAGFEAGQEAVEEAINNVSEVAGKMAQEGILDQGSKFDNQEVLGLKDAELTTGGDRFLGGLKVLGTGASIGAGGLALSGLAAGNAAMIASGTGFAAALAGSMDNGLRDGIVSGADLLTGKLGGVGNGGKNSWGEIDWSEMAMSAFLGAIGGAGQTAVTEGVVGNLGSDSGLLAKVPGLGKLSSKVFGKTKQATYQSDSDQLDGYGNPLYVQGDKMFEIEDDIAKEDVEYEVGTRADKTIKVTEQVKDAKGDPVMEPMLNAEGKPFEENGVLKTKPKTEEMTVVTKGQVITEEILSSLREKKILKEKKGEQRYQRDHTGALITKSTDPADADKTPEFIPAKRFKLNDKGQRIAVFEKNADGSNRKYSRNELDRVVRQEIETAMEPYKESIVTDYLMNQHAMYANSIGIASNALEVLMDRNIDTETRAFFIEKVASRLAILQLTKTNPNFTDAQLEEEVDKQRSLLIQNQENVPYMMAKQKELAKLDIARQALLSFETGTSETFKQVFKDIQKMPADKAKEKGYGDNYKEFAQQQLDKIELYQDMYTEYTGKHGQSVGKALFMNRTSYDSIMDLTEESSKEFRENLQKKSEALTNNIFNGNTTNKLKVEALTNLLADLDSDLKVAIDDSNLKVEHNGKSVSLLEANKAISREVYNDEYDKKKEEILKQQAAAKKEVSELEKELATLKADANPDEKSIKAVEGKLQKVKDDFKKNMLTPFLDYQTAKQNEKADKIDKLNDAKTEKIRAIEKEYEEKINKAYSEFVNNPDLSSDFSTKLSKDGIKSAIMNVVNNLSDIQSKKQILLQEAKELNDRFNRLRNATEIDAEWKRQQEETGNVRYMLAEIRDKKKELADNQERFNQYLKDNPEFANKLIGSTSYSGVRYIETKEMISDGENEIEVISFKEEPYEYFGQIETINGIQYFVPRNEAPFVVYSERELDSFKNVVIAGKEDEFARIRKDIDKTNEAIKIAFQELKKIKESKDKLINDKIAIENLIKNPVQDTDVAKLEKDKEEINKKIEELNQQYVPVIKDKDRLLKEKSNLHILKNSLSYYSITPKSETEGSQHEGYAIVAPRSFKDIRSISGSKLMFNSERIDREFNANNQYQFTSTVTKESNGGLKPNQKAEIIRLYVGETKNGNAVSQSAEGSSIVLIQAKKDSRSVNTYKKKAEQKEWAAKKTLDQITELVNEIETLEAEANAASDNITKSAARENITALINQLSSEFSESAATYFVEKQAGRLTKEQIIKAIETDNSEKYKKNPEKEALKFASPIINSEEGIVTPLFVDETEIQESELMTENETFRFINDLFAANAVKSKAVVELRNSVITAIENKGKMLLKKGDKAGVDKINTLINYLKGATPFKNLYEASLDIQETLKSIGFAARKYEVNNYTTNLFTKETERTKSETGPDKSFVDKAVAMNGNVDQNRRTKQTLREYYDSIMSYDIITPDESKRAFVKYGVKKMLFDRMQRAMNVGIKEQTRLAELDKELADLNNAVENEESFRAAITTHTQELISIARSAGYTQEDLVRMGLNEAEAELIYMLANDRLLSGVSVENEADVVMETIGAIYTEYESQKTRLGELEVKIANEHAKQEGNTRSIADLEKRMNTAKAKLNSLVSDKRKIQKIDEDLARTNTIFNPSNPLNDTRIREKNELMAKVSKEESDANSQITYAVDEIAKFRTISSEIANTIDELQKSKKETGELVSSLREKRMAMLNAKADYDNKAKDGSVKTSFIDFLDSKSKQLVNQISEFEILQKIHKGLIDNAVKNEIQAILNKAKADALSYLKGDDKKVDKSVENHRNFEKVAAENFDKELDRLFEETLRTNREVDSAGNYQSDLTIEDIRTIREQWFKVKSAINYDTALAETVKLRALLSQSNSEVVRNSNLSNLNKEILSSYTIINTISSSRQNTKPFSFDKKFVNAEIKNINLNIKSLAIAKAQLEFTNNYIGDIAVKAKLINVDSPVLSTRITDADDTNIDDVSELAKHRSELLARRAFIAKYIRNLDKIKELNVEIAKTKLNDKIEEIEDKMIQSVNKITSLGRIVQESREIINSISGMTDEEASATYKEFDLGTLLQELSKEKETLRLATEEYYDSRRKISSAGRYLSNKDKKSDFDYKNVISKEVEAFFATEQSKLLELKSLIEDALAIERFTKSVLKNAENAENYNEFDRLNIFTSKSNSAIQEGEETGRSASILLKSGDQEFKEAIGILVNAEKVISKLIDTDKSNYPSDQEIKDALAIAGISEETLSNSYTNEEGDLDFAKVYNDSVMNLEKKVFEVIEGKRSEIDTTLTESLNRFDTVVNEGKNISEFEGEQRTKIMSQLNSRLEKVKTLQEIIDDMREKRATMREQQRLLDDVFTGDPEAEIDEATQKRRNVFATALIYPELKKAVDKQANRIGASNRMRNNLEPIIKESAEISKIVDEALRYFIKNENDIPEINKDYNDKINALVDKLRLERYTKALRDLFSNNQQALETEMDEILEGIKSIRPTDNFNKTVELIVNNKVNNVVTKILNSLKKVMESKNIPTTTVDKMIEDMRNLSNIVDNHNKSYELYRKKQEYIPSNYRDPATDKPFSAERQLEIAIENAKNEKAIGKLQNKEYAYTKFVLENKLRMLNKAVNTMRNKSSDILTNQLPAKISEIEIVTKQKELADANKKMFADYLKGVISGKVVPSATGKTEAELMNFMTSIEKMMFKKAMDSDILNEEAIKERLQPFIDKFGKESSAKSAKISELNAEKNELEKTSRSSAAPTSFLKEIAIIEQAIERLDRPVLEFKNKMERASKTEIDKQIDLIKKTNYLHAMTDEVNYNEQRPENFNAANAEIYHVVRMAKEDVLTTSNFTDNPNDGMRRWQAFLHQSMNSSSQGISMRYVHFSNENADAVESILGSEIENGKSLLEIDNEFSKIEGNTRNVYAVPVIKEGGVVKYAMVKKGETYSVIWVSEGEIEQNKKDNYHLAYSNISGQNAVERTGYNTFKKFYLDKVSVKVSDSQAHPIAAFNDRIRVNGELLNEENLKSDQRYVTERYTWGNDKFFHRTGKNVEVDGRNVEPLFLFALAESNLGVYTDADSLKLALENMPIWKKLESVNEGNPAWESKGRNDLFNTLKQSYATYAKFKNQFADEISDFRNSILQSKTPMFSSVENLKMGSLKRNTAISLAPLSDVFGNTPEAKAKFMDRATISISGLNDFSSQFEEKFKGIPIIRMNGMNVEAYADMLEDNDIVLIMQLLNEGLANRADNDADSNKPKGARIFTKPMFTKDGLPTPFTHDGNIMGKDQYKNAGSLHKLVRFTNPSGAIVPNVSLFYEKGLKFAVSENGTNKILTLSKGDLNALGEAKNEKDLVALYETSKLKGTNLYKFIDFMRNKRKNILYVPQKRVSESNKYYHPVLVNGVNGIVEYDSYKEFLYETDRLKVNVVKHDVMGLEEYPTATAYAILNNNLTTDVKTATEIEAEKKKRYEEEQKKREEEETNRLIRDAEDVAVNSSLIPKLQEMLDKVLKRAGAVSDVRLSVVSEKISNRIEEIRAAEIAKERLKNEAATAAKNNTTITPTTKTSDVQAVADTNGIINQNGSVVLVNMLDSDAYLQKETPFRSKNSVVLNLFSGNNTGSGNSLNTTNPFVKIERVKNKDGKSESKLFGILSEKKVLKIEGNKLVAGENYNEFIAEVEKLKDSSLKKYLTDLFIAVNASEKYNPNLLSDSLQINSMLAKYSNDILFDLDALKEFAPSFVGKQENKEKLKLINNSFLNDKFNNSVVDGKIKVNEDVRKILSENNIGEDVITTLEESFDDISKHGLINLDSEIIEILINNGYIKQSLKQLTEEYYTSVAKGLNTSEKKEDKKIEENVVKFMQANRDLINAASFSSQGKTIAQVMDILTKRFEASASTDGKHRLATKNKTITTTIENTKGSLKDKIAAVGKMLGEKSIFSETMNALAKDLDGISLEVVNLGSHRLSGNKIQISRNNDKSDNAGLSSNIIHELIHANIAKGNTAKISKEIFDILSDFASKHMTYKHLSKSIKGSTEAERNYEWLKMLSAFQVKSTSDTDKPIDIAKELNGTYTEESINRVLKSLRERIESRKDNAQVAEEFITYIFDSKSFATMLNDTPYNKSTSFLGKLLDTFVKYLKSFVGIDVKVGSYLDKTLSVAPFLNDGVSQVDDVLVVPAGIKTIDKGNVQDSALKRTVLESINPNGEFATNAKRQLLQIGAIDADYILGGHLRDMNDTSTGLSLGISSGALTFRLTGQIAFTTADGIAYLDSKGNIISHNFKSQSEKNKELIKQEEETIKNFEEKRNSEDIKYKVIKEKDLIGNVIGEKKVLKTQAELNESIAKIDKVIADSKKKIAYLQSQNPVIEPVVNQPQIKEDANLKITSMENVSYLGEPDGSSFNNKNTNVTGEEDKFFIIGSNDLDVANAPEGSVAVFGINLDSKPLKRILVNPRLYKNPGVIKGDLGAKDISELEIIPGQVRKVGAGWSVITPIEIRPKTKSQVANQNVKDVKYFTDKIANATKNELSGIKDELKQSSLSDEDGDIVLDKLNKRNKTFLGSKGPNISTIDPTQSTIEDVDYNYQETIEEVAEDNSEKGKEDKQALRNKIYSIEPTIPMKYGSKDLKIDSAKMSHLMEGMTTLFLERLRTRGFVNDGTNRTNVDLSLILDPGKMLNNESIDLKSFYDDLFEELSMYHNEYDELNADFQELLKALGDPREKALEIKKELLARFKRELKAFKINLNEEFDEYSDSDSTTKDYIHDRLHYLTSAYDMTDISIKLLIHGLPELQYFENGFKERLNQSGLPKLIDGNKMFNLLQNYLNDAPVGGEKDVLDALQDLFNDTVTMAKTGMDLSENEMMILSLNKLFNAQVNGSEAPVNLLAIKESFLTNVDVQNMTLIGEFVQTFTKSQPNFTTATVQEDTVSISNAATIYSEAGVISKWRDAIETTQSLSGNPILQVSVEPIKTFADAKEFWKSLGINLSGKIDNASYLDRYSEIKNDATIGFVKDTEALRTYLATKDDEFRTDFNIVDFMNGATENDKAFANTVRNLAKVEGTLTKSSESKKHQTADGNDIHGVNLHSEATVIAADMNAAPNLRALKKSLPHLNSVYAKNSLILNRLYDDKGNRRKGINIKFGYSSGLIDEAEGVVIANLKANDKFVLDLASISRQGSPLFPFLRSADRGSEMTMQIQDDNGYPISFLEFTNTSEWMKVFNGYLLDEMNAIRTFSEDSKRIKNYGKNGGEKFRLFDVVSGDNGMLGSKKQTEEFIKFAKEAKSEKEIMDFIASKTTELNTSYNNYFSNKADEMIIWLRENDFIDDNFQLPLTDMKANTGGYAEIKKQLDNYIRKSVIGYVEQTKLITGDPVLYKTAADSFKRFKMFNATKKVSLLRDKIKRVLNNDMRVSYKYDGGNFDFIIDKINTNDDLKSPQRVKDFKIAKILDRVKYNLDSLREEDMNTIRTLNESVYNNIVLAQGKSAKATFSPAWKADGNWTNKFNTIVMSDVEFISSAVGTWINNEGVELSGFNVKYDGSQILYFTGNKQISESEIGEMVLEFANKFVKDGITNNEVLSAKLRSYVKPYLEINEADAEAYCTLPFYKNLLLQSGKQWNEQLENSYQKALRGEKLSYADYGNLELNEGFKGAFTKLKTHATGPLDGWQDIDDKGEIVKSKDYTAEDYEGEVPTAGYKHSLMPLLPLLIEGTPLEALNRRLIDNDVQLAQFISAVKYGAIGTGKEGKEASNLPFYDKKETNKSSFSQGNITVQTMDMKHIGIQVDMRPSFKEKVTAGTQFRKLLVNGMFDKGIPTDYREANKEKSEAVLQNNWNKLSDSQKESKSEMFKQSKEYADVQSAIYEHHYKKLKKEFGMDYVDGKLTVKDREGFVKAMINAMEEESKSINDIISVKFLEEAENPIEILANSKNFMYMLYALVNNRVIKEKRKGEGSPQSAVTGWENSGKFDRAGADSFLRSYRYNKDRTAILPSECMVALPESLNEYVESIGGLEVFNKQISDLLAKLKGIEEDGIGKMSDLTNEEVTLKKLITLVGFRIPNQGLSSSDILRIVEFKPTEFGSTIIVPGNMTAKAGSDFDIDKLTMYSANFKVTKDEDGKMNLSIEKYKGLENASIESLQNRMIELHEDIMLHSTKLRQLLSPVSDALFLDANIGVVWDIRFLASDSKNEHVTNYRKELEALNIEVTDKNSEDYKNRRKTIYYKNKTAFVKEQKKFEENNASWNDIFVPLTNLKMFMAFLSGKTGVGIAALQNTFNVLSQRANLGMTSENAKFIFAHNKDANGNVSFASLTSSDGDSIAETISAFINAYVDVAKDPFVFDINAGLYTSSTMFNILRAGASPVWSTRFLNQPIIKQFVKRIDAADSLSSKSKNGGNKLNENNIWTSLTADFFTAGFDNNKPVQNLAQFFDMKISLEKLYNSKEEVEAIRAKYFGITDTEIREIWLKRNADAVFTKVKELFGKEYVSEEDLEEMLYETEKLNVKYELTGKKELRKKIGTKVGTQDGILLEKQFALLNMFLYYKWQAEEMRALSTLSNYDTNGLQKTNAGNRDKFGKVRSANFKEDKTSTTKNKLYINGDKLIEGSMVAKPESIAFEYYQAVTGMSVLYDMDKYPKLYSTLRAFQEGIMENHPRYKNAEKYLAFSNNLEADFVTSLVLSKEGFKPSIIYDKLFSHSDKSKYKSYNGTGVSLVKYTHDLALIADVFVNKVDKNSLDFDADSLTYSELSKIVDKIGFSGDKSTAIANLKSFIGESKVSDLINYFAQTNLFRDIKYKLAEPANRVNSWAEMNNKTTINEARGKTEVDYFNANLNRLTPKELNDHVTSMNSLKELNKDFYEDILKFSINQSGLRDNRIHSMIKVFDSREITDLKREFLTGLEDNQLEAAFKQFSAKIVRQDWKNLAWKQGKKMNSDGRLEPTTRASKTPNLPLFNYNRTAKLDKKGKKLDKQFEVKLILKGAKDKGDIEVPFVGVPNYFFGIEIAVDTPLPKKDFSDVFNEWLSRVTCE